MGAAYSSASLARYDARDSLHRKKAHIFSCLRWNLGDILTPIKIIGGIWQTELVAMSLLLL